MEASVEVQEKPFHTKIAQAISNLSPDVLLKSAEEIARTIIKEMIETQEANTSSMGTQPVNQLQLALANRLGRIGQLRRAYASYDALLKSGLNIPALLIEKLRSCPKNIFLRYLEIRIPKGMTLDRVSTPKELIIKLLTDLIIEEFRTQIWPEEESEDSYPKIPARKPTPPQTLSGPEATPAPSVVSSLLTRIREMIRRGNTP